MHRRRVTIVVGGYVLLCILAAAACSAFVYLQYGPNLTQLQGLPLPTPHIHPSRLSVSSAWVHESFQNNDRQWDHWGTSNQTIQNGQLTLESVVESQPALSACHACPFLDQPYYAQADFSTNGTGSAAYGIAFQIRDADYDYNVFQIYPGRQQYEFWRKTRDGWSERASAVVPTIAAYPAFNTLGVYVNGDWIEFYINGQMVDTYEETGTSFEGGQIGAYVDDIGVQLHMRQLLVYQE